MSGDGRTNGRRVVVTGMGAVTPLGNDAETFWKNLTAGESGAGPITLFDASDFPVQLRLRAQGLRPDAVDRAPQGAEDRPLRADGHRRCAAWPRRTPGSTSAGETERTGVSVATGIGGLGSFQDCAYTLKDRGADRVNPQSIPAIIPNMGAAWVSMELGTRGPLSSQCTACAASNMAIGEAVDAIRLDRADVMLAGGTEAGITEVGIAGFGAMRALSRRNDEPEKASRPFDAGRDGFVMGEAGAIVVLEALEHAQARGAKIYAEVTGYGLSSDAQHVTEPDPTGRHPARAMRDGARGRRRLAGRHRLHQRARHVDAARRRAARRGSSSSRSARRRRAKTPISSTKGATGHCLGGSGAIEAIACILAVRDEVVPPTINYEDARSGV